MKKLIIINGTMGIGKTTICKKLYKKLHKCIWLEGDWCWMMNPFEVNEENKKMVESNITFLLNNFLKNSNYEYVIFNWVMSNEKLLDSVISKLNTKDILIYKISLICSKDELILRMKNGNRTSIQIEESIRRLPLYEDMNTIKIDTSKKEPNKSVEEIIQLIHNDKNNFKYLKENTE